MVDCRPVVVSLKLQDETFREATTTMYLSNQAQRVLRLALLCAATAVVASAQFESATVLGTITDPSAAPVSGATITLTNLRTGVSQASRTDASGSFLFVNQRLGSYRVRA